jgi:hypothetical protein
MDKSTWLRNQILLHLFGDGNILKPNQWWLAFYDANPGEDPTLNLAPEVSPRRAVSAWTVDGNKVYNDADITIGPAPAGQTWKITHASLYTAASAGQALYVGELEEPIILTAGQSRTLLVGQVVFTEM